MSERCPKCKSPIKDRRPKHLDEDRSWVEGFVRYECGVEYWNDCKCPFFTNQTIECRNRELETALAASQAEVERLKVELANDSWTAEMQRALDYIPVEFVKNDAWENGVKRMADKIASLRSDIDHWAVSERNNEVANLKAQLAADRGIIQGAQDRAADLQRQLDESRRDVTAWREIERLISVGAMHRKGFNIAEVDPAFIILQAADEFTEFVQSNIDPEEFADLLGVLYHFAIKRGWTLSLINEVMLTKFRKRFTERAAIDAARKEGGE